MERTTARTVKNEKRIKALVDDIRIAMLTTLSSDGSMRSRPMMSVLMDDDETIWFLASSASEKTDEIVNGVYVNLAFSCPEKSEYVSISGTARVEKNTAQAKKLWHPLHRAWFPKGPDDPNLVVLSVKAEEGEYWDAPTGKMVQFAVPKKLQEKVRPEVRNWF